MPKLYNLRRRISSLLNPLPANPTSAETSAENVFTKIYKTNAWSGIDSISGRGSEVDQTSEIIRILPTLLKEYEISTLLDIPCGDFNWMKNVNLNGITYIGADIVSDLINKNSETFQTKDISFIKLNLIADKLPTGDMILCRDCLVHLSFSEIQSALDNICNSGSKYLLTTTFTREEKNRDITTGQWRPLNLEIFPFFLPKPLTTINEGCTEASGKFADKSLGLWRTMDIRENRTHLSGKFSQE